VINKLKMGRGMGEDGSRFLLTGMERLILESGIFVFPQCILQSNLKPARCFRCSGAL
jgi:hypothetical protein